MRNGKPLVIDLFCGLGGWADGFLAEGYDVLGFDIERHDYGTGGYPAQLVLQDVLTLHGSQFKDAAVIVASPPCQEYSYMAMPWSRAKNIAAEYRSGVRDVKKLTALFDACFRIAKEAGVPLIVENVRGAQPWVGRSRWNYGSFHLWGDVPALMPITFGRQVMKDGAAHRSNGETNFHGHAKVPGFHQHEKTGKPGGSFQGAAVDGLKRPGRHISQGFNNWPKDDNGAYIMPDGTKQGGDWFSAEGSISRTTGGRSQARKAASAQIAKIPLPLARHIARVFKPQP